MLLCQVLFFYPINLKAYGGPYGYMYNVYINIVTIIGQLSH